MGYFVDFFSLGIDWWAGCNQGDNRCKITRDPHKTAGEEDHRWEGTKYECCLEGESEVREKISQESHTEPKGSQKLVKKKVQTLQNYFEGLPTTFSYGQEKVKEKKENPNFQAQLGQKINLKTNSKLKLLELKQKFKNGESAT